MRRCHARLPLVGDQAHAQMRVCKTKIKNSLRREKQVRVGSWTRLPLVGPEPFKTFEKGTLFLGDPPTGFQAHPSMRICFTAHRDTVAVPRKVLVIVQQAKSAYEIERSRSETNQNICAKNAERAQRHPELWGLHLALSKMSWCAD